MAARIGYGRHGASLPYIKVRRACSEIKLTAQLVGDLLIDNEIYAPADLPALPDGILAQRPINSCDDAEIITENGLNAIVWTQITVGTGAQVYIYCDAVQDTVKEVDIAFNTRRSASDTLFWTTYASPQANSSRDPDGPKDIQDVAVHELGTSLVYATYGIPRRTR